MADMAVSWSTSLPAAGDVGAPSNRWSPDERQTSVWHLLLEYGLIKAIEASQCDVADDRFNVAGRKRLI